MIIIAVVVTFNRIELLKKSIDRLRLQPQLSQILVVNNGSTDGTTEWLQSQKDLIVVNQDNVGGSGGFYTGIQRAYEAGAEWIWCMDDDVFPRPDCLKNLLKHIGEPRVGILAPRRLLDGKIFTHEFQRYNFYNPLASMKSGKLSKQNVEKGTEIAGADFEGPFIRREVVENIGLPNKDLFIFCDDTDYCLRTYLAGFRLLYVPEALMDKHQFFTEDTWTTRNQKKKWKRYYQIRNEAYLNHHYGRNWGVRYGRSFIGLLGYIFPALLSMPFTDAWHFSDLRMLWTAYKDGIHERLGKRKD
ncbi:MAG: glycosyltransferase family 2 protein [Prevotella sp.]|nr:glycosyltransferase family 2 protein [Prevotella sp.]